MKHILLTNARALVRALVRPLVRALTITLLALSVIVGVVQVIRAPASASSKWWGEYFANRDLSGAPAVTRYDDVVNDGVNFNWGVGSPHSDIPADNFSVRWTREAWFGGGTYRFTVISDDGVRIWVGDELVVDEWRDRDATPRYIDHYIPAGVHPVRIEYFEHQGGARISVGWKRVVGGATWRAEYYNTRDLAGPVALQREDAAIDFNWEGDSPHPAVNPDHFSVRWTRTLGFTAGVYRFFASVDDGVRVWVDDQLVIDAWKDQAQPNTSTGDIYLPAGLHTIVVEYYEHTGGASAHVWWRSTETFGSWRGQYFDNPNLVGGPALERDDPVNYKGVGLDFDWGVEPPVDWMPDDNFSIRWTRTVDFTPGYYRFVLQADDGARLWIDDGIVIDKWQDMDYELHYVDGTYLAGQHTIKLAYYEHTGSARIRFWWEPGSDDDAPPDFITGGESRPTRPVSGGDPAATAYAGGVTEAAWADGVWAAAYFDNVDLKGRPALSRVETALDHNWGLGSPGDVVPNDYFSARWRQSIPFEGGVYRFTTYTDDGVRLWVNGELLIDAWRPMRGYRSATVELDEGDHEVVMAYYERTGAAIARLDWRRISR